MSLIIEVRGGIVDAYTIEDKKKRIIVVDFDVEGTDSWSPHISELEPGVISSGELFNIVKSYDSSGGNHA